MAFLDFATPVVGLAQALMGASAASSANDVAMANLAYQKQRDRDNQRLATATRTDQYGNVQRYNPATNAWEIQLTPLQQALQSAQTSEQYKGLTKDAAMRRELAQQQFARSQEAGKDYQRAQTGYRYDQPPSQESDIADVTQALIQARSKALNSAGATLGRQALRLGQSNAIPAIMKGVADQEGAGLEDQLIKGKAAGKQAYAQDVSAHENKYLPALRQFASTMDDVQVPNLPQVNPGGPLSAEQGSSAEGLVRTALQGNQSIGAAYNDLVKTQANMAPDFSSFIQALEFGQRFGTGKGVPATTVGGYGDFGGTSPLSTGQQFDFSNYGTGNINDPLLGTPYGNAARQLKNTGTF